MIIEYKRFRARCGNYRYGNECLAGGVYIDMVDQARDQEPLFETMVIGAKKNMRQLGVAHEI